MDGQEQAAIHAYRVTTAEPMQAEMVVIVRKLCDAHA